MWKQKNEGYEFNYNLYITKPYRKKSEIYILIISILILFFLILIAKQSIDMINRKIALNQYIKQANIIKEEQERIEEEKRIEEARKLEEYKNKKMPELTDEGKDNIENIYHSETKRAFLTFDDGPSSNTSEILDILKQENVPATFFVLGNAVERQPELVKRAYQEGHYIANHGYSHIYSKIYASPESVLDEYNNCNTAVQNAIENPDYNSHLFRFPGGLVGGKYAKLKEEAKDLLNENDVVNVDWNCLTGDAETRYPTEEQLMDGLIETSNDKNSIVVLMHDAAEKTATVETLPKVINYLREQGYEFKNFYEIIK